MTLAQSAIGLVKFSTAALPPRRRVNAYREMLDRSVGSFDVETAAERFEFSANSLALPGLGVAQIASSALRVERPRGVPIDETRDLVLAVVHDGTASTVQRGREVIVEGSGAYLSSSHDPLVMQRTAARLTNYSLLSSNLAPALSSLDGALLTAMPTDSEAIRLLTGYTDMIFKDGAPASAESRRLVVNHIHDLIALAAGATRDAAEIAKRRGLRAARRADLYARAERFIALRSDDADLTPEEIAHSLGVSSRLLQKVFAERGETMMARVWNERLNRAQRLLTAPETADRSITDIAFACGFNDSSHFGRVFSARIGIAPSRWRKQAREQPAERVQ